MMAVSRPAATAAALTALLGLSGCVGGLPFAQPATKQAFAPSDPALATPAKGGSAVIDDLAARQSILPAGGPFATIADAVVAEASGATEAELRMRRLQAEARAKNWLPRIGPTVTLGSLGQVAAQIVLDQALFDHGRRKAERAHAAADVEVAAVALVQDMNDRAHDGIAAWLSAEQARAQAAVAERAAARLAEYEGIVALRVQGGLSDRSEHQIITQTRTEMQATLQSDRQAIANALAELATLTGGRTPAITGTDALPDDRGAPVPLTVLAQRAQGARTLAEADMARSGLLPGLGAQAVLERGGEVTPSLTLGGATFGAGMGAERRAIDATPDLVERRNAEAADDAERSITRMTNEIGALRTRQQQGAAVLAQTQANLDLFAEQYRLGGRSLVDLVGQFAAAARLERDQVSLGYEIARMQLAIARDRGILIDGSRL
jgi:adhesin transport system outer membrane protein